MQGGGPLRTATANGEVVLGCYVRVATMVDSARIWYGSDRQALTVGVQQAQVAAEGFTMHLLL